MNLGELKNSLSKFPPDMDDAELLVQTGYDGKTEYDQLTFVAIIPDMSIGKCLVLGTLEATRVLVREGKLRVPDDYVPPRNVEDDNSGSN